MDVDKLIKFPIYNIFDTTEPLIGEKVLFSNLMKDFSNIEKLKSGILTRVDEKTIYRLEFKLMKVLNGVIFSRLLLLNLNLENLPLMNF